MQPIKTIYDKRLAYLVSLSRIYEEQGYKIILNGRDNLLEIYPSTFVKEVKEYAEGF